MVTIARGLRDAFLIFVTPVLVVMGIGWLVGDEEGGAWSAGLVGLGWVLLLWFLALRPAWQRMRDHSPSRGT